MSNELRALSIDDMPVLCAIAHKFVFSKSDLGWVDTPDRNDDSYATIMEHKLQVAYSERFLLSFAYINMLVTHNVAPVYLIQHQAHDGAPFDSTGWVVVVIGDMPMFHVSPEDFPMEAISSLVYVVPADQRDDPRWCWKGTNKESEYAYMLGLNT